MRNNNHRGKRAQVAIDDFNQYLLMLNEEEIERILEPFIKPKGEFYTTSKKEDTMWGSSVKIQDFETSEDIWNNSVYVIDRSTQKIKIPRSVDDWMRCETVLVYNVPGYKNNGEDRFLIKAGTMCRCWRIWIQF